MKQQVLEIIDKAPPDHFDPKLKKQLPAVKQRISKLADLIDDLGRLDETTGEVFIDEKSLRKLLREASAGSEDAVIARLRQFPDQKFSKKPGLKPIPWETLAERMDAGRGSREVEVNRGQSPYSSLEEVRQEVRRQSPDIPSEAFDGETLYHQFKAVLDAPALTSEGGTRAGPNAWDCMVRKLGWFVATMVAVIASVVVLVVAAVAIAAPGVPALTAVWWNLFWATFWAWAPSGIMAGNAVSTLILVIACVVNPAG
jgi:hypothetical protein